MVFPQFRELLRDQVLLSVVPVLSASFSLRVSASLSDHPSESVSVRLWEWVWEVLLVSAWDHMRASDSLCPSA